MSRTNARSRRLRHRPSRVIPATLTSVVLLAVGALAALLAITRLVDGSWPTQATGPAATLTALTWGSAATLTTGAVVALLGLILLVAGLKRGAFSSTALQSSSSNPAVHDTDFVISTRAVARLAAARADQVDGVDGVTASASGRHVHLKVTTTSEQVQQIRDQVNQGVSATLTGAGLHPTPRVSTTVRTKGI
jgi:hypothetical protein